MQTHFTLIGRPTTIFKVVRRYTIGTTIPCVVGITLDGKFRTVAGEDDIVWMN